MPVKYASFHYSSRRTTRQATNKNTKGYPINRRQHKKVVAYADDITLIITEKNDIQQYLQEIHKYCEASGAKINKDKTEAIILGSWNKRTIKEAMSWLKDTVKVLGITYSANNMNRLNFEHELEELNRKTKAWGKRSHNLLIGRLHLLNIYIQPRLSYKLRHLDMPKDIITKYNKLVYDFLWEGKAQAIAQTKISMTKHMGGTGHIDIETRQKAIWLKQLNEVITNPNEDYNKITRSTIGPIPKLNRMIQENNNTIEEIAYSELIHKPKIKYLRTYIRQNEILSGKTKGIYQQLKAHEYQGSDDQKTYFKRLQLEKNPKLYQYGLLTGHKAHKTRHWLFNISDVKESQGKCNTCKTIETSDHILNH